MDVNEVLLPGVGLRYEFVNADGDRIGVIARRSGSFEIVAYGDEDPDEVQPLFRLTTEEAGTVAEILGAPRIIERFAELTKEIPGLIAGQIPVPPGSPHAEFPLGHTKARTRTGASIVAIVRGEQIIPSPGPADLIRGGDVLVVIGTEDGIAAVQQVIAG
jgi:TrkA domain protein